MSQLDRSKNSLQAKIVVWGPRGAGKTAILNAVRRFVDPEDKLRLYTVGTHHGSTRFFDLLPLEDFTFGSYRVRTRLFGAPGDPALGPARVALLDGADAVIFVADSSSTQPDANLDSLHELTTALESQGRESMRLVWCFNKRDAQGAIPVHELKQRLGCDEAVVHETVATEGTHVFECFSDAFESMMKEAVLQHSLVGPDGEGMRPARLLPQLARGAAISHERGRDADERVLHIPVNSGRAAYGVQAVDAQIRLALAHAELEVTSRMLEGRNRELMAINRVARSILSAMDPDNLLVVTLDATAEYLGVSHASCVVFDPREAGSLRSHVRGFGRDPVLGLPPKEARYLFGLLQNSDGPIPACDDHNPQLLHALRRVDRRVKRALYQSIRGNSGTAAGWLGIYSTEDEPPLSTQRLLFLSSISRLAALGLEKIGLLEETGNKADRLDELLRGRTSELELAKAKLRALNRGMESRVTERTRALEESIRSLRESRAGAIHTAKLAGMGDVATSFAKRVAGPVASLRESLTQMRESLDDLRADLASKAQSEDAIASVEGFDEMIAASLVGMEQIAGALTSLQHLGGETGEPRDVDLNAIVADAITLLEERIRACAELDLRLGSLPHMRADAAELRHTVLALLTNAVEATEAKGERGRITVSSFASRNEITWMVQDTGCGIDPELVARIFEPFVTTKQDDSSAGLGMHCAYRVVKALGGTINVRSKVDEGTTVKVVVPVHTPVEEEAAPAPQTHETPADSS